VLGRVPGEPSVVMRFARVSRFGRPSGLVMVGALVALAWLALAWWGESPYGRYLDHRSLDADGNREALLALFVAGWVVMIVAMMLPTSAPLVLLFGNMVSRRADARRLLTLLLVGYLSIWTAFGLAVFVGDGLIHTLVAASPWLQAHVWLIGAATLLVAGGYQFTPLKYRCLEQCRSPLTFITSHWRGRHDASQAFLLGVHHGMFCVGCCWSLMLIMFAVGMGSLAWMLGLGTVMAVEKNLPWGRRLAAPLGAVLVGSALVVTAIGGVLGSP
jgi:predicted metal-binding membrane protein